MFGLEAEGLFKVYGAGSISKSVSYYLTENLGNLPILRGCGWK